MVNAWGCDARHLLLVCNYAEEFRGADNHEDAASAHPSSGASNKSETLV